MTARQWFYQIGIIDLFSGGNFRRLTIFAPGIMPYITASIILQLLVVVWPYLERLQKEGEHGPAEYYAVHALSDDCSERVSVLHDRADPDAPEFVRAGACLHPGPRFITDDDADAHHRLGFHHVARRADQRPRHRQRNVVDYFCRHRGWTAARGGDLWDKAKIDQWGSFTPIALLGLLALMAGVIAFIVFVEGGQRRIPVQYAKRVMGRR